LAGAGRASFVDAVEAFGAIPVDGGAPDTETALLLGAGLVRRLDAVDPGVETSGGVGRFGNWLGGIELWIMAGSFDGDRDGPSMSLYVLFRDVGEPVAGGDALMVTFEDGHERWAREINPLKKSVSALNQRLRSDWRGSLQSITHGCFDSRRREDKAYWAGALEGTCLVETRS
jgi:hypothetical protein